MEVTLLFVAFATGLVGSLHCIGMCGPIALALPVGGFSARKAFVARLTYNIGRILAYASLGYIFGYFGLGLQWAGLQQWLSISIGVIMFALLFFHHLISLSRFQKILASTKQQVGRFIQQKSFLGFFVLGVFNGYLPCGILYIALAGATATSTPLYGALYMIAYGLGTSPALLVLGVLPQIFKSTFRIRFQKVVPVYSFLLALFFVIRGLNLGIPYVSPKFDTAPQSNQIPICHGTGTATR